MCPLSGELRHSGLRPANGDLIEATKGGSSTGEHQFLRAKGSNEQGSGGPDQSRHVRMP